MFKTTAGEVRRRLANSAPDGSSLGSNWHNEDTLYAVAFTGDFPQRAGPPVLGGLEQPTPATAHLCSYIGNGAPNTNDSGSVWSSTQSTGPTTLEAFFGG